MVCSSSTSDRLEEGMDIDHMQLPIILWAPNAQWAQFVSRTRNIPQTQPSNQYYIGRMTIYPQTGTKYVEEPDLDKIPKEFCQYHKVFSEEKSQCLPHHTIWDHTIELLPNALATLPGWLLPLTKLEKEEMQKFVKEHLQQGMIHKSWSPYTANFFFVKKKDGKLQLVQDYWPINKWTKKNQNVSPLIPQTINHLSGCTLFTKFDVQWGYNNVHIKNGNEWKVAFLTPEGLFEPTVMFFGLTNLPATFQMIMNMIFCREVAQGWLFVYMDNIAIHTKPLPSESELQYYQQHIMLTHQILQKLHNNDLYLKPFKCEFAKDEIEYLGVIVGKNQMCMDPHKLDSIHQWKSLRNPTEVCQFLGFTRYYQYFIPNYSKIACPLLDLTKKTVL